MTDPILPDREPASDAPPRPPELPTPDAAAGSTPDAAAPSTAVSDAAEPTPVAAAAPSTAGSDAAAEPTSDAAATPMPVDAAPRPVEATEPTAVEAAGSTEVAAAAEPTPVAAATPMSVDATPLPAGGTPTSDAEVASIAVPTTSEPGDGSAVVEPGGGSAVVEPVEKGYPTAPVEPVGTGSSPRSGRRPTALLGYLGVAVLGIAIGAGALAIATGGIGGAPSPSPSPSPTPSEAPAGNTIGRSDAPVTIEVWADYQCPYCHLEDLLFGGALEREYVSPGIARIVYRDFSFLGQESTDAAVAARCAGAQEAAAQHRYHDALYTFQQGENQGRFVRANLIQIAAIAGVPDAKAFEACLDDPAVAKAVADETTEGRNLAVTSTPTLRLRGPGGERVLEGFSQTWPPLRDAVEAVRAAPGASPSAGASAVPSSPGATSSPSELPGSSASPGATSSPSELPGSSGSPGATSTPELPSPSASPTETPTSTGNATPTP